MALIPTPEIQISISCVTHLIGNWRVRIAPTLASVKIEIEICIEQPCHIVSPWLG